MLPRTMRGRPPPSSSSGATPVAASPTMSALSFTGARSARAASASRPRALFALPTHAADQPHDPKKSRLSPAARLAPTSAVVSTLTLALVLFALAVTRNLPTFLATDHQLPSAANRTSFLGDTNFDLTPPNNPPTHVHRPSVSDLVQTDPAEKRPVAVAPPRPDSSRRDVPDRVPVIREEKDEDADEFIKIDASTADSPAAPNQAQPPVSEEGKVGPNRSWPVSEVHDDTGLYPLARHLAFTNRTLLNYFHMHKTGGVTTKVELMHVIDRQENKKLMNKRGSRMRYVETCYQSNEVREDDKSIEKMWRCDFGQLLSFSKKEVAEIDVVMGHQYWEEGCDDIFAGLRSVKYFSIFRHPLPRKLSFFYHFFVRNIKRDQKTVDKDEVIKFLTGEDMPQDPRVRDAGPNYYASRMLSNGLSGYGRQHRYEIPWDKEEAAIAQVVSRLDQRFVFVGLQLQTEASQCMLQKAVQVFAHVHGIDEMVETGKLAESSARLNAGAYPWTARKIWDAMTVEQRQKYREVEKVDLAIYDSVVKRFRRDAQVFSCEDKVKEENWAEDVFEV